MGFGVFTAGLILAVMIIPFIAAVMRDVFETAPPILQRIPRARARRSHLGGGA